MYGEQYLAHYGVPGMKWGVRRERMARARAYYKYSQGIGKLSRKLSKNEKRTANALGSGKDTTKLLAKKEQYEKATRDLKDLMATKGADLTKKELLIGKGEVIVGRALKAGTLGGMTVAGLATGGLTAIWAAVGNNAIAGLAVKTALVSPSAVHTGSALAMAVIKGLGVATATSAAGSAAGSTAKALIRK